MHSLQAEIQGMLHAHVRDSVALSEMADILERGMERREDWTELKVAKKLAGLRRAQDLNRGLSFPSISAYGANGAVIHYKPTEVTDTKIGYDALFLLDSGMISECTLLYNTFLALSHDVSRLASHMYWWLKLKGSLVY